MLSGYTKLYTLIKIIYLHILVLRDIIYTDGEGNIKRNLTALISQFSNFILYKKE